MADDRAEVRIPQITDMDKAEAYVFLCKQITLHGKYAQIYGDATARQIDARSGEAARRRQAIYEQLTKDLYRLTIGSQTWGDKR